MLKRSKNNTQFEKIEIIAIIQKNGSKSPHSQYARFEIHFTPRAQIIGS